MILRRHVLLVTMCLLLCLVRMASAELDLSLLTSIDISSLGFSSVGGAAFDDATGHLWISDAGGPELEGNNRVVEFDVVSEVVVSSFDASVVPGLTAGPDALALDPSTGDLYVFSSFNEDFAGVVSQSGEFIRNLQNPDLAAAAFDSAGDLFGFGDGGSSVVELNATTGAVINNFGITDLAERVAAADFDPFNGRLIAYGDDSEALFEISLDDGNIVSTTNLEPFVGSPVFPTGLAFNASGDRIYLASGENQTLYVFSRTIPEPTGFAMLAFGFVGLFCLRRGSW